LDFSSSKTYDGYLLFLRDTNGDIRSNNGNVGTGNNVEGFWAANAAGTLIYF